MGPLERRFSIRLGGDEPRVVDGFSFGTVGTRASFAIGDRDRDGGGGRVFFLAAGPTFQVFDLGSTIEAGAAAGGGDGPGGGGGDAERTARVGSTTRTRMGFGLTPCLPPPISTTEVRSQHSFRA